MAHQGYGDMQEPSKVLLARWWLRSLGLSETQVLDVQYGRSHVVDGGGEDQQSLLRGKETSDCCIYHALPQNKGSRRVSHLARWKGMRDSLRCSCFGLCPRSALVEIEGGRTPQRPRHCPDCAAFHTVRAAKQSMFPSSFQRLLSVPRVPEGSLTKLSHPQPTVTNMQLPRHGVVAQLLNTT